ncbi:hypothetical protein [Nocardia thailandica]|uniref:hypothetical protein n=1 Tax=Nocardia thailandica TaxID=257275 RepID=UPI00030FAB67|nr:hypothetical protein [Nocardia thailandica]
MTVPPALGSDPEIRGWRRRRLLAAGFSGPLADAVLAQPGFDLHELLQLVDRGCPPRLAVGILAPLPGREAIR